MSPLSPQHISPSAETSLSHFVGIGEVIRIIIPFPNRSVNFHSSVKHIDKDTLLVAVPAMPNLHKVLSEGREIHIEFTPAAIEPPKIKTTVLRMEQGQDAGCWLQLLDNYPEYFTNKRRHVRVPMDFPCTATVSALRGKTLDVSGTCINLSGGGMRIESSHQFQSDERVSLTFKPDTHTPEIQVEADVIFSKYLKETPSGTFTTALKFVHLSQSNEDKLVGLCFRKELQLRRHLK